MALAIQLTFVSQPNVVVPVNEHVARVTSVLGAPVTLANIAVSDNGTLSLYNAPAWISLVQVAGAWAIEMSQPAIPDGSDGICNFAIIAQTSTKKVGHAITLVVREPLEIKVQGNGWESGPLTVGMQAWDASVAPILFRVEGANGSVASNIRYVGPDTLPAGLLFMTDTSDGAALRVQPKSSLNPSGGIKVGVSQIPLRVKAFRSGALYDSPENAAIFDITLNVTSEKQGTLETAMGAYFDNTAKVIRLNAYSIMSGGKPTARTFQWSVVNGSGSVISGGGTTDSFMVWQPSGTSVPIFTVGIKDINNNQSVESFTSAVSSFSDLTTTRALDVDVFPNGVVSQDAGKVAYVRVTLPDITIDASLAITIDKTAGAPAVVNGPDASVVLVSASGNRVALLAVPIPATAKFGDAWTIQIAATSGFGAATRTGAAAVVVTCAGAPALFFDPVPTQAGFTGSLLAPQQLSIYYWQQLSTTPDTSSLAALSTTPSIANSTKHYLNATEAPDLYVVGNEPGLFINQAMQLTGQLIHPLNGYAFKVGAYDNGFRWNFLDLTLTSQAAVDPIIFSSFVSSTPLVTNGSSFDLNWGYNVGAVGDFSLKYDSENAVSVQGTFVTKSLNSDAAVYSLRGTNTLNGVTEYFAPSVVVMLSDVAVTVLPPSPAVFTIDEDFEVNGSWQPKKINGGFQDYGVFNIWVDPGSNAILGLQKRSDGNLPTGSVADGGTDDARRFKFMVTDDSNTSHIIDMQGIPSESSTALESPRWDSPKAFPVLGAVAAKTTALLNEPVNISIDATTVGTRWRVVFDDQPDPMWLKINQKVISKAFSTSGTLNFRIEVMNDFSNSYPPVKMIRTLTRSIYISDQLYMPPSSSDPAAGIIGLGGDVGYEITGVDPNVEIQTAPYAVFVKGLAKDETTQELKMFIATTRGRDGSSVLGTMAADVFPIPGRPHMKELLRRPFMIEDRGNIVDPVAITTTTLGAPIIVGKSMTPVQLTADGGTAPYAWSALGLPYGIHFTADGTLSGTMLQTGSFLIAFSVKDSSQPEYVDKVTLELVSMSDLEIYKPQAQQLDDAYTGVSYQVRIEARGGVPAYHHAVVFGAMPKGLSLNADTGYITGFPVAYNAIDLLKTYTFVVETTDAFGAKAQKHFDMNLKAHPLAITDPDQSVLFAKQAFRIKWGVYGGVPPYTISGVAGSAWFLFKNQAALKDGCVTALTDPDTQFGPGVYTYTFTITDSVGTQVQRSTMFLLNPQLGAYGCRDASPDAYFDGASTSADIIITKPDGGYSIVNDVDGTFTNNETTVFQTPSIDTDSFYHVIVSGPATPNQDSCFAPFTFEVMHGTKNVGKFSRLMRFQNTVGAMTSSSPKELVITASPMRTDWFATLNTLAGVVDAGLSAAVQDGSSLPPGMSLDPATGVIYGAPSAQLTSSVIEFRDFQQTLFGLVTVLWDIRGSKITITGEFDPLVMWVPYQCDVQLNGASDYILTMAAASTLPDGVAFTVVTDINGVKKLRLSGKSTEAGIFDAWIYVKDANNHANEGLIHARVVCSYNDRLHFITDAIPEMIAGIPFKVGGRTGMQLQVKGGGSTTYSFSVVNPPPVGATSGILPQGLSLSTTGVLSGTPADQYTLSTFDQTIGIRVADDMGNTDMVVFEIVAKTATPITITTATVMPDCVQGALYPINTYLQATGGVGAYRWSVASDSPSQLPPGLTLTSSGVGAGLISGTPTAYGNYTVKVKAMDDRALVPDDQAGANTNPKILTFEIHNPIALHIDNVVMPMGMVSLPYPIVGDSVALTCGGGVGPYTWTILSQPAGLNAVLVSNDNQATVTATPTSQIAGGTISIQVTDSQEAVTTRDFAITIVSQSAPQITNVALNGGQPNLSYSDVLIGSAGVAPYVFSIDITSPTPLANLQALGLQLNPATGVINGVPNAAVTKSLIFRITDIAGQYSLWSSDLNIACGITIDTSALAIQNSPTLTWHINSVYNGLGDTSTQLQVKNSGGGGVIWAGTNLPPGMTLSAAGVLSGRPTVVGAYQINVSVTDMVTGCHASTTGWLVVSASTLAIVGPTPGTSYKGIPGRHALNNVPMSASGGAPAYMWSLKQAPSWIQLDYNTGVLTDSCVPSPGVYSYIVMCTDSDGNTVTASYSIDATVNIFITSALGVTSATTSSTQSLGTYYTSNPTAVVQQASWLNRRHAFTVVAFGCNSDAPVLTLDKYFTDITPLGATVINGVTGFAWKLGDPTGPLTLGVNTVIATINDGNGVVRTGTLTFVVAAMNSSGYKLVDATRVVVSGNSI